MATNLITEEEIASEIAEQFTWDPLISSADLEIEVKESGEVTLTGTVPSLTASAAAEADACSVEGVTKVINRLAVEFPDEAEIPPDEQLQQTIESMLRWSTSIGSKDIDVSVSSGIVTLEGSVDAYWKKLRAESIASDMYGVLDIDNRLSIVPAEKFTDEDIATEILNALERGTFVDPADVDIKVENGVVSFGGTVDSLSGINEAEDAAYYTLGVTDVINNLKIGS